MLTTWVIRRICVKILHVKRKGKKFAMPLMGIRQNMGIGLTAKDFSLFSQDMGSRRQIETPLSPATFCQVGYQSSDRNFPVNCAVV